MSAFVACTARITERKSVVLGGYLPSYTMSKPAALALTRAPPAATWANSASAATIATVFGAGVCALASSKKPFEKAGGPSGPVGTVEKYRAYLNSRFTPRPRMLIVIFLCAMITGIAGATMLVA